MVDRDNEVAQTKSWFIFPFDPALTSRQRVLGPFLFRGLFIFQNPCTGGVRECQMLNTNLLEKKIVDLVLTPFAPVRNFVLAHLPAHQ
jgi:hypothetical protein